MVAIPRIVKHPVDGGPCQDRATGATCEHERCEKARALVLLACPECGRAIGYGTRFHFDQDSATLRHWWCAFRAGVISLAEFAQ